MDSVQAITQLVHRYAELVDDGDFTGVGELLAEATFENSSGAYTGAAAISTWFRQSIRVYPDGTPRTSHLTTNLSVDVDEQAGTATSLAYFTVLQATPELPLRVIASGRYRDGFVRRGGEWRFARRWSELRLAGDLSAHLVPQRG